MPSYINTNVASLNAQRNLASSQSSLQTSLQRLSSGLRVNSAMDDAAGIAIGAKMTAQIRGLTVATRNANDGISLAQTAEGALATLGDMAQRMRELAVQATNATNGSAGAATPERAALNTEFQKLAVEMDRAAQAVDFNGTKLFGTLGATAAQSFGFQIGANQGDTVSVSITSWATIATGVLTSSTATGGAPTVAIGVSTGNSASTAIASLDTFISAVNTERANLGAAQSNLHATVSTLQVNIENLSAARGRVMDTDYASETANLTRAQILQQAGTAMLAQANQSPQSVLSLLK